MLFYKIDAELAKTLLMSLLSSKTFEVGNGFEGMRAVSIKVLKLKHGGQPGHLRFE